MRKFSAAGYFFGRKLQRHLDVPIGLIAAASGGSAAEYWIPAEEVELLSEQFENRVLVKEILETELAKSFRRFQRELKSWRVSVQEIRANGQRPLARPENPLTPEQERRVMWAIRFEHAKKLAGKGWFEKIQPLTGMPIRGVIWYQGESNVSRAKYYPELMSRVIEYWRDTWEQPDLPFLMVQLANYNYAHGEETWAALRAAQKEVADAVPDVGLAVAIDIGDPKNIHPKNKQEVGRRLALVALNKVYGVERIVASGPQLAGIRVENGAVVLVYATGGKEEHLVLNGDCGFELAGKDSCFFPARAALDGEKILLTSDIIKDPVIVRYAWANHPSISLFNSSGLPAAPFQKALNPESEIEIDR